MPPEQRVVVVVRLRQRVVRESDALLLRQQRRHQRRHSQRRRHCSQRGQQSSDAGHVEQPRGRAAGRTAPGPVPRPLPRQLPRGASRVGRAGRPGDHRVQAAAAREHAREGHARAAAGAPGAAEAAHVPADDDVCRRRHPTADHPPAQDVGPPPPVHAPVVPGRAEPRPPAPAPHEADEPALRVVRHPAPPLAGPEAVDAGRAGVGPGRGSGRGPALPGGGIVVGGCGCGGSCHRGQTPPAAAAAPPPPAEAADVPEALPALAAVPVPEHRTPEHAHHPVQAPHRRVGMWPPPGGPPGSVAVGQRQWGRVQPCVHPRRRQGAQRGRMLLPRTGGG